jgi:hypothetical protein
MSFPDVSQGQLHHIPHQFFQIERQDIPRPDHLQRGPKMFLRLVELVLGAFEGPNALVRLKNLKWLKYLI